MSDNTPKSPEEQAAEWAAALEEGDNQSAIDELLAEGPARAPMAFMIPIWRTCWVRMAVRVLTIRKPLKSSDSAPMPPKINEKASRKF